MNDSTTRWLAHALLALAASGCVPAEEPGAVRKPLPTAAEIAKLPADGGKEFNRLIHESSPYLLQHARNPVDWHPWGDEAFARAAALDRPVFMSVGYSTCHWCHVMEHESFENEEVAALLNERFVCIKVDREERPDVDNIYMAAVQAMTGRGGWPMSIGMTHDRKPFWGGTYFPREDRGGRPGFMTILSSIAETWRDDRKRVGEIAQHWTMRIQQAGATGGTRELTVATLGRARDQMKAAFDEDGGGFLPPPKFPRSHALSLLLRVHDRDGDAATLRIIEQTLEAMERGGIHDQLGGGFHRYSTDSSWLVPHFEKMLYDQALLATTYLEAFRVTGKADYADTARDILGYVLRDMRDERGGFFSAEDADSEGVEGKFYVWTTAEIEQLLGKEDGQLFCKAHGAEAAGNFRDEATGESTPSNILHLPRPLGEVAGELGIELEALEERLAPMRQKLFHVRERRVHPYKDDKVLTDWNGLMISALAQAGSTLGDETYLDAARQAAEFLLDTMLVEGRLLHRYRRGEAGIPAYLDDHASFGLGLLDLYEATFEPRWLAESLKLAEGTNRLFWDEKGKGYLFSSADGEAHIAETKEIYDGAVPSGNSMAVALMARLGRLTGRADLEQRALDSLDAFSAALDGQGRAYPAMLMALDFVLGPTYEIVLAGTPGDETLVQMEREVWSRFLPRKVVALHPADATGAAIRALAPLVEPQGALDGKATAYVCEHYVCKLPTTDPAKLGALLDE